MRCQTRAVCSGLFLGLVCWSEPQALAQKASDSFPQTRETEIGGHKVKLVMTGHAIRKKAFLPVYAIAAYIQQGSSVRTAQDFVEVDCPKQLHLIMLRKVAGETMAESTLTILRENHPEPAFADEAKALAAMMRSGTAQKGDHIWITHVPKIGLHFKRAQGEERLIPNVAFSSAIWENYFGEHNASEAVKSGLLSMLPK